MNKTITKTDSGQVVLSSAVFEAVDDVSSNVVTASDDKSFDDAVFSYTYDDYKTWTHSAVHGSGLNIESILVHSFMSSRVSYRSPRSNLYRSYVLYITSL